MQPNFSAPWIGIVITSDPQKRFLFPKRKEGVAIAVFAGAGTICAHRVPNLRWPDSRESIRRFARIA